MGISTIYINPDHGWGDTRTIAGPAAGGCEGGKEESGLARVRPVSEDIYSLEVMTVDGHEKRGGLCGFPPALNVTYLLEADENDPCFQRQMKTSGGSLVRPGGLA